MFNGELLKILSPHLDLNTLEEIKVGGVGGTAVGYVTHLEIGVNNTFFSVPAVFSFEFSPDEFGGLAGQLGFFIVTQDVKTQKSRWLRCNLLSYLAKYTSAGVR